MDNLGSDLAKHRQMLLKKLNDLNKNNLETLINVLEEKTAGLIEMGDTRIASLITKIKSEV